MKRVILNSTRQSNTQDNVVSKLIAQLSNLEGVEPAREFPTFARNYRDGKRIYVKYRFDTDSYQENLNVLLDNGYSEHEVFSDRGSSVEEFLDTAIKRVLANYPETQIDVNHKLWGATGHDVWDEITLTVH